LIEKSFIAKKSFIAFIIKLGLMKQFVKALNKENKSFQYLISKFSKLSIAKIKVFLMAPNYTFDER